MHKVARGSSLKPQVRPAKTEDLASLIALENICFKEETFNKKQLRYLLLKARSFVLVVSIEGSIVGSMIILLRNNIYNARIYSLNVHPAYRHRGLGGLLIDTVLKFLKEKGFKKITLEVGVNNTVAQHLYISKSFSVDKILRKYYKNGDDALHLIKKL